MNKIITLLLFSISISLQAIAQDSPVGLWKTIDDKTGEAKSLIEIFEEDGKFHGKISKLLLSPPEKVCDKCPGRKKGKKLVGMRIVENLESFNDYWKSGSIMDPESGKEYNCSIWFEKDNPNQIKVRGKHWTGLFRTQTWYRASEGE